MAQGNANYTKREMAYYFLTTVFFIICLLKFFNSTQRRRLGLKKLPPSPPSLPIVGHLHLMKEPIHRTLQSISESHGKILLLRFGSRNILLVSSPSAVEECFTTNDVAFSSRPFTMAGNHFHYHYTTVLAAPYGDLWRNLRRFMTHELFSSSSIAKYAVVREAQICSWAQGIANSCHVGEMMSNTQMEMKSKFSEVVFNAMTMITLGETFYGEGATKGAEAGRKFEKSVKAAIELSGMVNLADFFPILKWRDLIGIEKKMVGLMAKLDGFFQNIVDQHRKKQDGEKKVVIDEILALQQSHPEMFTDDIIKGIVMVLFTAGTETTASTLEWALALLLNHPKSMSKLRAEIDAKVGHDRLLNEQDLPNLNYLQHVISETHRLYPAVPIIPLREASEECTIGGYTVPKNTILMINAWAIHRDPDIWDNPTQFIPERFEGVERKSVEWKLIPFSGGRRRCPASVVANRQIGLALGCLVQLFDWGRIGDEEIDMTETLGLTMPRASPLNVLCKPRESAMKLLFRSPSNN